MSVGIRQAVLAFLIKLCCICCFAQNLRIGDKLPNVEFSAVINYPSESINLSHLKSKLIILDFWATNCFSCIEAFPKMDSLQKKYGERIQIVAVNRESKDSTLKFFKRFKKIKMPGIPFVVGDTLLAGLFPHVMVPHHVWIDSLKTVKYITYGWNANVSAINKFLEDRPLSLSEIPVRKATTIVDPLVEEVSAYAEYYSFLTRFIPGASMVNKLYSTIGHDRNPNRLTRNSASVLSLYKQAFSEGGKYNFEAKSSVLLKNISLSEIDCPVVDSAADYWIQNGSYNYDLLVPPANSKDLYKIMQQDLAKYFELEAKVKKRKVQCWSIVRTSRKDKIKSKGNTSKYFHQGISRDSLWYYHNLRMPDIANMLQGSFLIKGISIAIVDDTKYSDPVDIAFVCLKNDSFTLADLRSDLKKYDLDIIATKKKLPVLVLKKNKK